MPEWEKTLKTAGIKQVITYHKTLNYFMDRFGIQVVTSLEAKPGVPPTAAHVLEVINTVKSNHIPLIAVENFFETGIALRVQKEVPQVKVESVPVAVGGSPDAKSLLDLYQHLVNVLSNNGKVWSQG
jgi:zinc/manganese transport system substrate-binding protein